MKKKIFGITLAIALVVLSIFGTTMAYFTSIDDRTQVFTAGNVEIEFTGAVFDTALAGTNVYPGQTLSSTYATVENTGSENAFVGIIITLEKAGIANIISNINDVTEIFEDLGVPGENFDITYTSDATGCKIYVISKNAFSKDGQITFFKSIKVPTDWDNEEMAIFSGVEVDISAYATQQYGFGDAKSALVAAFDAWSALAPQNP